MPISRKYTSTYIAIIMRRHDIRIVEKTPYNRIFPAGDCDKNDMFSAAEETADSLSKEGVNVVFDNPHADEKARGQMTGKGTV